MASSLPKNLAKRGHRVMVITPRYQDYEDVFKTGKKVRFATFGQHQEVIFFLTSINIPDMTFIIIDVKSFM